MVKYNYKICGGVFIMRRYELGMSLDYVSNWTIVDAVREIFQNSLDEEIQNPENKWYFNYDEENEVLKIGNKSSRLSTKSLLMGCSSKKNDENTIGQHGEGYKVATIVLLRNNCSVKIYNYNEKEIWTAKVIKSRRYDANIGVYDIEKMGILKSVPENNLIFEISGISSDIYKSIKEKNLWLQDDLGNVIESEGYGRVLLEDRYAGKVFVKGLYVCDKEQLTYGYDLNPSLIKLDRDRGLIDSFDLQYSLGNLIIHTQNTDFIYKTKDLWDGYYIRSFTYYSGRGNMLEVYNRSLKKFRDKYGEDAFPCTNQAEFNKLKRRGYNVAMVSENEHYYISRASGYVDSNEPCIVDDRSIVNKFEDWFKKVKPFLSEELLNEGLDLLEDIKEEL